jgi:hypothetical protein
MGGSCGGQGKNHLVWQHAHPDPVGTQPAGISAVTVQATARTTSSSQADGRGSAEAAHTAEDMGQSGAKQGTDDYS